MTLRILTCSNTSFIVEGKKNSLRMSLKSLHSMRMCLTVSGHWQVTHSGWSFVTKEANQNITVNIRNRFIVVVITFCKEDANWDQAKKCVYYFLLTNDKAVTFVAFWSNLWLVQEKSVLQKFASNMFRLPTRVFGMQFCI